MIDFLVYVLMFAFKTAANISKTIINSFLNLNKFFLRNVKKLLLVIQAASLEKMGLQRMVRDVRNIEKVLGDGIKRIWDSEKPVMKKLRSN